MAGYRNPASICYLTNPQNVADETSCLAGTPPPGSAGLLAPNFLYREESEWGYQVPEWRAARPLPESLGGATAVLRDYKDVWVRGHRKALAKSSSNYGLPAEILAGIAWIQSGGKGYSNIDSLDVTGWQKAELLDKIKLSGFDRASNPDRTLAHFAERLELAAAVMSLDFNAMSEPDKDHLFASLLVDEDNLAIAARQLWELKEIDFPGETQIGPREVRIITARYFRGPEWALVEIQQDLTYGDFLVDRLLPRLGRLLSE